MSGDAFYLTGADQAPLATAFNSKEPPKQKGMRTWIENGSFYVGVGVSADEILLQNVDLKEAVPFISYDFEDLHFRVSRAYSDVGLTLWGPGLSSGPSPDFTTRLFLERTQSCAQLDALCYGSRACKQHAYRRSRHCMS